MKQNFDLIVIGAGSAGISTSRRAASLGARVALIEESKVGGTCILRGCVPKKLLMYAAEFGKTHRIASSFGWTPSQSSFSMTQWASHKAKELSCLNELYSSLLEESGVSRISGSAAFSDTTTVSVDGTLISAPKIVIATGSRPSQKGFEGIETLATSDDLLDLKDLPRRAAIIGAGYIGVEFASILANLGVEVTLLFPDDLPLANFDLSLRTHLAASLTAAGVILRPKTKTKSARKTSTSWELTLESGEVIETNWAMNATGRVPDTAGMGLETIGVTLDKKGSILVNQKLETSVSGVYAVGDVTNRKNLTPVAVAEGRWLAEELFSEKSVAPVQIKLVATGVFTLPPIGSIGSREDECPVGTKIFETEFKPLRHSFAPSAEKTYLKILVDPKTDHVLGIHMFGADAPEIIQSLAVAMTMGVKKKDFDQTMAVHPTSAEEFMLLREAKRIVGEVRQ